MSKTKFHTAPIADRNIIEVKSKFDAEFRRFCLKRNDESHSFEKFNALIKQLHGLACISYLIRYIDPRDHDLLPINNDDNFGRALKTAQPILRIIVQREEDLEYGSVPKPSRGNFIWTTPGKAKQPPISIPHDFRQVSSIIDVDIVPETHRRVRLLKHGSDKPLGFYIRDGVSVRVTQNGFENKPGIFISRLVPGGLAESTGLLAVNDEVIEVNGIEVAGKTLDQVTDMMVANSSNLIITFKPANQRTLTSPRRGSFSRTSQLSSGSHHTNQTNTSDEIEQDDQDEIVDLTGVRLDDNNTPPSTIHNSNNNNHHNAAHQTTMGSGSAGNTSSVVETRDGVLHL